MRIPALRTACAALIAATAITAPAAHAGEEAYYSAYACQATDMNGVPIQDVHFRSGVAENFHPDATRLLACPVPYNRNTNNLESVSVRLQGFDNTDDDAIRVRVCQRSNAQNSTSCTAWRSSGDPFQNGFTTLTATLNPGASTRWIYAQVEIPDQDANSGRSYVIGYRVCRGGC